MSDWKAKLKEAKELLDEGFINEQDYEVLKQEALEMRRQSSSSTTVASTPQTVLEPVLVATKTVDSAQTSTNSTVQSPKTPVKPAQSIEGLTAFEEALLVDLLQGLYAIDDGPCSKSECEQALRKHQWQVRLAFYQLLSDSTKMPFEKVKFLAHDPDKEDGLWRAIGEVAQFSSMVWDQFTDMLMEYLIDEEEKQWLEENFQPIADAAFVDAVSYPVHVDIDVSTFMSKRSQVGLSNTWEFPFIAPEKTLSHPSVSLSDLASVNYTQIASAGKGWVDGRGNRILITTSHFYGAFDKDVVQFALRDVDLTVSKGWFSAKWTVKPKAGATVLVNNLSVSEWEMPLESATLTPEQAEFVAWFVSHSTVK